MFIPSLFLWFFLVFLCSAYFLDAFTTLITFDVDGTLIHGSGQAAEESAHAQAFSHAVGEILGKEIKPSRTITPVAQALPRRLYQGSTDGLILLRLAQAELGIKSAESYPYLDTMMDCMYQFIQERDNAEISKHISPLPGVLENLLTLAELSSNVKCGLVTGNVEGIARRKMESVGIFQTGALSPPCPTQKSWNGTEHLAFLGGFGSDYCSGNIEDLDRNHLDRGEQIAIAMKRCQNMLQLEKGSKSTKNSRDTEQKLTRVVHVGDAPADVLAAKAFSRHPDKDPDIVVGMVAVATGSYDAAELKQLAGDPIPGIWEPVVLERGMGDPTFLAACGLLV